MRGALFRLLVGALALLSCATLSGPPGEAAPTVQAPATADGPARTPAPVPEIAAGETVDVWVTTGDAAEKLNHRAGIQFALGTGTSPLKVQVDEITTYQQMDGFGAALTDSAAWVISHTLSTAQRGVLLEELFSPEEGIGISYVRLPMGASDFVTGTHYTYDDMPPGQSDPTLANFSIDHDRPYILPLLRQAWAVNPQLRFMASPWSAPAWMKSPETLYGGSLLPASYATYAQYFARFIQAYQAEGVAIHAVAVQNEPHHTSNTVPTMWMEWSDQAEFVKNHLGPTVGNTVEILIWDHNWDEPIYPLNILADAQARAYVAGSAWHCYAGSFTAQGTVHDAHPDKGIYFTECSGGGWDTNFASVLTWNMHNLFIGAVRSWAKMVLLWNLALDENHGPYNGGCSDCRGVVTVHNDGTVEYNVEYYIIGHLSKFVVPGAYRIASSIYEGQIETVAFRNVDGSTVLVVLNPATDPITFDVQWHGQYFSYELPAQSVATFVWREMARVYLPAMIRNSGSE